jgi:hypothetical protein
VKNVDKKSFDKKYKLITAKYETNIKMLEEQRARELHELEMQFRANRRHHELGERSSKAQISKI